MGADYTVGGLFVNWPIRGGQFRAFGFRSAAAFRFREATAIVRREKSF
ncbi:hypothetical protein X737_02880 [Mesorhizobium sp. L48C026A00]|nr:hypothetical protein X737_02880 [Mesorhizobium sp. L48C026A00]